MVLIVLNCTISYFCSVFPWYCLLDMIPERNALVEHIYPQLKDFCRQQYRLEFQVRGTIIVVADGRTDRGMKREIDRYIEFRGVV